MSNLGRVKSLARISIQKHLLPEKILKPDLQWNGRLQVRLQRDRTSKAFKIHRLVAQAFIPNPDDKPEVNHIDGNPLNNCVTNLEWVTKSENVLHAVEHGLSRAKENLKYATEKNKKPIIAINLQTNEERYFSSIKECAEKLHLNDDGIIATAKERRKSYKNYYFKYARTEVV